MLYFTDNSCKGSPKVALNTDQAKRRFHENLRALENNPKAILVEIEIQFCNWGGGAQA